MTTLNKIRAWSFAAFLGALALADWQVPKLVADGDEIEMPKAEVGGAKVTAAVKDVAVGDKVEKHWVVALEGDGKGELKLTCTKTPWQPMSRMMPRPEIVWTKTVAFDTSEARSIDLGLAPDADAKFSFELVLNASEDDEAFGLGIHLAQVSPVVVPETEGARPAVEDRGAEEKAIAAEISRRINSK